MESLQRLEVAQERQPRGRRWEQIRDFRSYTHYESQKEDQEWRVHHFEERRHQHPTSNFPSLKLPSFNGERDPNVYLEWEAKVEQIFNVYEVQED